MHAYALNPILHYGVSCLKRSDGYSMRGSIYCFLVYKEPEPLSRSCLWQNLFIKHNLAHISVLNYALTL